MKTLKKTLCLVLAVVMALGVLVLPASAADETVDANAKAAFDALNEIGVITGTDGKDPNYAGKLTRNEVAAIVYRVMTGDTDTDGDDKLEDNSALYAKYADVYEDAADIPTWAKGYVGYLTHLNVFQGDNGKFLPEEPVTYVQLMKVMLCCIGYNQANEFTGENWETNVLAAADEVNLLGLKGSDTRFLKVEGVKAGEAAVRGNVFQIVKNGAFNVPRVTYYNGTYSSKVDTGRPTLPNSGSEDDNTPLISYTHDEPEKKSDTTLNAWGMPTSTTTEEKVSWAFNNPVVQVKGSEVLAAKKPNVPDDALYDSADTENFPFVTDGVAGVADIAAALKIAKDTTKTAKLYRDGTANTLARTGKNAKGETVDNLVKLTLNSTDVIGDYGCHTMIFANTGTDKETIPYIIVMIDTFMATENDDGDLVLAGELKVNAKGNGVFEPELPKAGKTKYAATGIIDEDGVFTATADPKVKDAEASYELTDKYARPVTVKAVYIGVDPDNSSNKNTVKGLYYDLEKDPYVYSGNFVGNRIELDQVKPDETVILLMTKDNYILGFGGEGDKAVAAKNDNFVIVKSADVVRVSGGKFVIEVDGYDLNGKAVSGLRFGDLMSETEEAAHKADGDAFEDDGGAEHVLELFFNPGNLVQYKESDSYLYVVSGIVDESELPGQDYKANTSFTKQTSGSTAAFFDPRHAEYKDGSNTTQFLVNEDTVVLLATYSIDNTTKPTNDYKFVKYVVSDFRSLPYLEAEIGSIVTDFNTEDDITIQAVKLDKDGNVVTLNAGDYADIVVINGATVQIEDKPAANGSDDQLAYIYGAISNKVTYPDYYKFHAFIDGEATTLNVALNAGKENIKQDGFYIYEKYTTGGYYSKVTAVTADNKADPYGYAIDKGVLTKVKKVLANDKKTVTNVVVDEENTTYFTISEKCEVYGFNPLTGKISKISDLDDYLTDAVEEKTGFILGEKAIYFEIDKYGMIYRIYVDLTSSGDEFTIGEAPAGEKHELSGTVGVSIYPKGTTYQVVYYAKPDAEPNDITLAISDAIKNYFGEDFKAVFKELGNGKSGYIVPSGETVDSAAATMFYMYARNAVYVNGVLCGAVGSDPKAVGQILKCAGVKVGTDQKIYLYDAGTQESTVLGDTEKINATGKNAIYLFVQKDAPKNVTIDDAVGEITVAENKTLTVETVSGKVTLKEGGKLEADKITKDAEITATAGKDDKSGSIMDVQTTNPDDVQAYVELTSGNDNASVTAVIGAVVKPTGKFGNVTYTTDGEPGTATVTSGSDYTFAFKVKDDEGKLLYDGGENGTLYVVVTQGDKIVWALNPTNSIPRSVYSEMKTMFIKFNPSYFEPKTGTFTIKVIGAEKGITGKDENALTKLEAGTVIAAASFTIPAAE